ncbi:MFS transporter [Microvirga rosea]|uniref:MFS transporter n=1 Tax=Microvirga rosea TaxID=2715425 RepID=UPI001D0AF206|nr:MFS transporter [Microvirga rosea]MCB8823202.1 MFS transporter [Microvirga rosea]
MNSRKFWLRRGLKKAYGRTDLAEHPMSSRALVNRREGFALAALISVFALSQAFRTLPAIIVRDIEQAFQATPEQIGTYAGIFHFTFAMMQIPVGICLDRYGSRTVVLVFTAVAIAGAGLCAVAPSFAGLLLGQALIGVGCSPALMASLVYISREYPSGRFGPLSGLIAALGGLGMLLTTTPLAWCIEHTSWRIAVGVLGVLSALSLLACLSFVHESAKPAGRTETVAQAIKEIKTVVRRDTAGIFVLGFVTYAAVVAIRGLWIVPIFVNWHSFSLREAGYVAFAMTVAMIVGPALAGPLDPGPASRRGAIILISAGLTLALAVLALGAGFSATGNAAVTVLVGMLSSVTVLQYAYIRSNYPAAMIGRALATFNMSVFLGIATVQGASGAVAAWAVSAGLEQFSAVLCFIAVTTAAGLLLFSVLPRPVERLVRAR